MTNTSSNAQCIIVVYNSPSVTFDLPIPQASSIQQMPSSSFICCFPSSYSGRIEKRQIDRSIVKAGLW